MDPEAPSLPQQQVAEQQSTAAVHSWLTPLCEVGAGNFTRVHSCWRSEYTMQIERSQICGDRLEHRAAALVVISGKLKSNHIHS